MTLFRQNDIIATSSREQGSEVARPPLIDNTLAHVARNDIIAARPRWNDITADRPPMNDIIQARRARNDITVPIPRHGHSSHQLGHSSPLPPFLLFSLGAQWAHAQLLQGVDTAHSLPTHLRAQARPLPWPAPFRNTGVFLAGLLSQAFLS